ncbi:hypothetical protein DL766_000021 [Monosporascus sp. MC13-8B]|uniref:Uncharacterized protein n=1 Tax=Monosporascus cannonballus TaxID=155416 RepID=A0ABY0HJW3_9PEZI|nr:hypothetical protein DL762_000390 [Monosporascus cannonballus]RYP01206.1 hypothetical protein DL763_000331 [Monosporascus cannonballus]RYP40220.1 hypothetical protein DL766_000021 [Monosporascus sp. MC13-8B]
MATENLPDIVSSDPASTAVTAATGLYHTPPSSAGRVAFRGTCPFGDYLCYYPLSDHAEDLPKFLGGIISVVVIVALLIYASVKRRPGRRLPTMNPREGADTGRDIQRRAAAPPPYESPAGIGDRVVVDGCGRDPTDIAVGDRPPSYGTTLIADDVSSHDPRDIHRTPDNSPVLGNPPRLLGPHMFIFATLFHKLVFGNKFTGPSSRILANPLPTFMHQPLLGLDVPGSDRHGSSLSYRYIIRVFSSWAHPEQQRVIIP